MVTPTAALGLAVIMVLATRFHLKRKEPAPMTIGLFVLCTVVVVGRGFDLDQCPSSQAQPSDRIPFR